MSVLNQYVAIAQEDTYGTLQADDQEYRGVEATGDGFQQAVIFVEGGGYRPGKSTQLAARRRKVDRGGTGSLEFAILSEGVTDVLGSVIGKKKAPTTAASGVYTTKLEADANGPDRGYSILVGRSKAEDGSIEQFQYLGCVPTGFEVSIEEGGKLMLRVDYDFREEKKSGAIAASGTDTFPVYPGTAAIKPQLYIFEDCELKIGGTVVDTFKSFSISGDLAMDTERYFVQESALKKQPIRKGVPAFTGTMSGEFYDLAEYDRFVDGAPVKIELEAEGDSNISATVGSPPSFKVTAYAAQYGGSTPQMSEDSVGTIECPFTCLMDADNKTLEIEIKGGTAPYLTIDPASVEVESSAPKAKK